MASEQIGTLDPAVALDGTETLHVVQAGESVRTTAQALANFIAALLVDNAPLTLDTLKELAAALGDDPNFAATIAAQIAAKADASRTINAGTALTGGGALDADRTIAADMATAAQIRSAIASKLVDPALIYAALAPVTLASGTSIAVDMHGAINFDLLLAHNGTVQNPTNPVVGKSGVFFVTTSGANRTLDWANNWKFEGGVRPDLSTSSGALAVYSYITKSATEIVVSFGGQAFG